MQNKIVIIVKHHGSSGPGPGSETKSLTSEWRKRIASRAPCGRGVREGAWEGAQDQLEEGQASSVESFGPSKEVEDRFLEAAIKEKDQDRLLAMLREMANGP